MPPTTHQQTGHSAAGFFTFTINLASENVRVLKQARLALVLVVLALVLLAGKIAQEGLEAGRQHAVEVQRTADLRAQEMAMRSRLENEGLSLSEEGLAELRAQVQVANSMIRQRVFSWSQLLADLEGAVPWGVSLNDIQPQSGTATLTLRGDALTLSRLTTFVIKLEESPRFDEIFLSDQKSQSDGTVAFTLNVHF